MRAVGGPAAWAGPAALRVEERQIAGDAGERALVVGAAGVVDHPGLQRDAAAGGLHEAQRAPLLGPVDDRGGGDQPVAAGRRAPGHDRVAVGVAGEDGDHARVGVEEVEDRVAARGLVQRLVDGDQDVAVARGRELALQRGERRGGDEAAGAGVAADEVEDDEAEAVAGVGGVVEAVGGLASPLRRRTPGRFAQRDHVGRVELGALRVGRDADRVARQPGAQQRVDLRARRLGAAQLLQELRRRRDEQAVAGRRRAGRGGGRDLARDQDVVVAQDRMPRRAQAGAADRLHRSRRAAPGGAARRRPGGSTRGRRSTRPGRPA